jgi:putative transposase
MTHVKASFRRNDRRVNQYLHKITKDIIHKAKETKSALVLEDIKGIRKLYRKANCQGNKFGRKLGHFTNFTVTRQYVKAFPYCIDPKRTSQLCPRCGGQLQEDRLCRRKLWCVNCRKSMDRDLVASLNIAYNGWARFTHPGGLAVEAVKGNVGLFEPLILRVDGSKLIDCTISRK